jgi:ElaB/YqjD/DUF883 family membrane-anchored ribosome-binding protein
MHFLKTKSERKIQMIRDLLQDNNELLEKFEKSLIYLQEDYLKKLEEKNNGLLHRFKNFLGKKLGDLRKRKEKEERNDADEYLEKELTELHES